MSVLRFLIAVSLSACVSLVACGSPQQGVGGGDACEAKRSAAIERITKVLDQSLACTADDDCTTIPYGNACFDACTRSVAKAGAPAVVAALNAKENTDCPGCPVIPPPCAPPSAARCVAGKCQ